jgi:hypothetical protein
MVKNVANQEEEWQAKKLAEVLGELLKYTHL